MTKEKELEVLKHLLLITRSNELKWEISPSTFNNSTQQNFSGVCKTYKLNCKIEFNDDNSNRYIFISIKGSKSPDSNFGVYVKDSNKISSYADEMCNEIIKQTKFKITKEENPFDDLLNDTGIYELRNEKLSSLLSEDKENDTKSVENKGKKFFGLF